MKIGRIILLTVGAGLAVLGWAYWTAISDPVVREVELALLPVDATPAKLRVLLMTDIHVAGPDMPPSRLRRIVAQANALKPDAIVITGDLVSDKLPATRTYSLDEAISRLARLESRLGVFAVLGNHDHWRNAAAARRALKDAGIRVLDNSAVSAGSLSIGGVDDRLTGHEDLGKTLDAMAKLRGAPILLSHSPDPFPELPSRVQLMVAGHTHCGQIRLPLIGARSYASQYGARYGCGVVRENGKTLVVSAGLGTSILPLRIGAVPDMWLITLRRVNPR
jgi:predicted MPP superfamily phosphohydrolase